MRCVGAARRARAPAPFSRKLRALVITTGTRTRSRDTHTHTRHCVDAFTIQLCNITLLVLLTNCNFTNKGLCLVMSVYKQTYKPHMYIMTMTDLQQQQLVKSTENCIAPCGNQKENPPRSCRRSPSHCANMYTLCQCISVDPINKDFPRVAYSAASCSCRCISKAKR